MTHDYNPDTWEASHLHNNILGRKKGKKGGRREVGREDGRDEEAAGKGRRDVKKKKEGKEDRKK